MSKTVLKRERRLTESVERQTKRKQSLEESGDEGDEVLQMRRRWKERVMGRDEEGI